VSARGEDFWRGKAKAAEARIDRNVREASLAWDEVASVTAELQDLKTANTDDAMRIAADVMNHKAEISMLRGELKALRLADAKQTILVETIDTYELECIEPGDERGCPSGSECPQCIIADIASTKRVAAARKTIEELGDA